MINRFYKIIVAGIALLLFLAPKQGWSTIDVSKYHDGNILELVSQFVPENPIILEAGAHYGVDTVRMKYVWPQSIIYAFEPNPQTFNILQKIASRLTKVHCHQLALNDYNGECTFYVSVHDGASSLLEVSDWHRHIYQDLPPISVRCFTLDTWAKRVNVPKVDFIWFDMEGVELKVMKCGQEILKSVKAIYLEVNFKEFRKGMSQYDDIYEHLTENGFQQIYITPNTNFDIQANVLFVRKELLK